MIIGVIGSGMVGQALTKGFLKHGHDVMVGTGNKAKVEELKKALGTRTKVGTFAETAKFGELIVLAVKGLAAEAALKSAGAANLKGKIVIDVTNPIADAPPVNGVITFFTGPNESLMEKLQSLVPEARFVKAFSCIGSALMVNPNFGRVKPSMFMCGNDAAAKRQVNKIVEQFGFEPEDMGQAEAARAIEPLCILWCIPGFLRKDWNHAIVMVKK